MSWNYTYNQSNDILSDGLYLLKSQSYIDLSSVSENSPGNYLISLENIPYYIGEGKVLSKRIKQQSNSSSSTFYRNYQKELKKNHDLKSVVIQFIQTNIGRKEIEEFGIVNLPTKLNGFQLGKREIKQISNQNGLWVTVQNEYYELIKEGENEILNSPFTLWFYTECMSTAGLYLVIDKNEKLIYIGESSNIEERISTHSGQTYFSALRRHIETEILGYELQIRNGKKRYFSDTENKNLPII